MSTLRSLSFCLVLAVFFMGTAMADEPEKMSEEQRAEHLAYMKEVAASITLADSGSKVKLIEEPVLRYVDNTRRLHESSLWIWSAGGRPSAVLAVEFYPTSPKGPRWLYEIASLSTERISATREPDLRWTAKGPGLALQTVEGADAPADKAVRRLAQMKEIRKRFTAHESAPVGGRIELRPLSSPLFRYADLEADILDGAIFAYANGTNPEVLLVLEAHARKGAAGAWRYGLVQMTGAALSVELGGKEVWQREEADPPAVRDSYVNGWIPSELKKK